MRRAVDRDLLPLQGQRIRATHHTLIVVGRRAIFAERARLLLIAMVPIFVHTRGRAFKSPLLMDQFLPLAPHFYQLLQPQLLLLDRCTSCVISLLTFLVGRRGQPTLKLAVNAANRRRWKEHFLAQAVHVLAGQSLWLDNL